MPSSNPAIQLEHISSPVITPWAVLHLAFRHPQLFSSVSAHSAALIDKLPTFLAGTAPNSPRSRVLGGVFGNPPDLSFWDQNSPIAMAQISPA